MTRISPLKTRKDTPSGGTESRRKPLAWFRVFRGPIIPLEGWAP